jgi:hypothetical protein
VGKVKCPNSVDSAFFQEMLYVMKIINEKTYLLYKNQGKDMVDCTFNTYVGMLINDEKYKNPVVLQTLKKDYSLINRMYE